MPRSWATSCNQRVGVGGGDDHFGDLGLDQGLAEAQTLLGGQLVMAAHAAVLQIDIGLGMAILGGYAIKPLDLCIHRLVLLELVVLLQPASILEQLIGFGGRRRDLFMYTGKGQLGFDLVGETRNCRKIQRVGNDSCFFLAQLQQFANQCGVVEFGRAKLGCAFGISFIERFTQFAFVIHEQGAYRPWQHFGCSKGVHWAGSKAKEGAAF